VTADLLVIVPTRSRPQNVVPVAQAWLDTGGFDAADLLFGIDYDDPRHDDYLDELQAAARLVEGQGVIGCHSSPHHEQLVPKLNGIARLHADFDGPGRVAYGFAGDDHMPRTPGWSAALLAVLRDAGTAVAYPDDGYQGENLPTTWYVTRDIVTRFGMVPAPVEHLFCDNAVRDLARAAGCLRYVPEVVVEHVHPVAGKAVSDEQYERVNGRPQWRADKRAYRSWRDLDLPRQAAELRALMTGE
jgi:hypothetical protein